jgi:heterodisulfide reductase subunit A-like polyferredoxin
MYSNLENRNAGAVLVRGAEASGVQAALDLAGSGFHVYLTDPAASIGGTASDSVLNTLAPKLEECAARENIEILTFADIESVSGQPGDFRVKLRRNPRYVDPAKCDACGDCAEVCPVSLPASCGNDEKTGKKQRKAIALEHSGAVPNVFNIVKFPGRTACTNDCPAGVNVQGFISLLRAGKIAEAYALLLQRCPLPASSGRVCRRHCEDHCRRMEIDEGAVAIRNLERYVADAVNPNDAALRPAAIPPDERNGRVAVIGGGPAGLAAANDLNLKGVHVTLFEAQEKLGGMLRYGIPAWRLPKDVLEKEIQAIVDCGVEVRAKARVVRPKELLSPGFELDGETYEPFDAVLIATGAWGVRKLNLPGENSQGVWQALDFLYAINSGAATPAVGPNVVVLGGDDLALDAARAALRLPGVQTVHLACMESWVEMPADPDEVEEAFNEGIIIHNGLGPTGFEKSGERVSSVRFRACTSVYDEHRSYDPIFDDSIITHLPADTAIVAAGRAADAASYSLETKPGGRIFVYPETQATAFKGIFAAGDATLGPASMAEAMAGGRRAAEEIYAHVLSIHGGGKTTTASGKPDFSSALSVMVAPNPSPSAAPEERAGMPRASGAGLQPDMSEINLGYDKNQAMYEAKRCLDCGLCSGCRECVKACAAGAIIHDERTEERLLSVGGVIVSGALSKDMRNMVSVPGVCRIQPPEQSAEETTDETDDISGAIIRGGSAAAEIMRQFASLGTDAGETAPEALIIGGGPAGMTAAQYIAGQGYITHLVEKTEKLGGLPRGRRAAPDTPDILNDVECIENLPEYMRALEKTVRTHPNIKTYLNAGLASITGRAGDFSSVISFGGNEISVRHAVTIIATGGRERETDQYLYGKNPAVVTQSSLGETLADGGLASVFGSNAKPTIMMMQCVESLTQRHPYCSRVCCAQALRNALEIKNVLPYSEIVILGGERLTHGAEEVSYLKALEKRVRFIRYSGAARPEVCEENGKLLVRVYDADFGRNLEIYPDMLALSTGIAPAAGNQEIARMLDEKLSSDGFFIEAHPALRPVDLQNGGIFLCGCARRPRFIREAVADARAAAARAASVPGKAKI